ncbi:MAG TPA: TlpA disulfide reductase family protein [Terracidiphilus sp.]|nr:TlpA disulfide reductase family protein [Terracidiphilus sp.]
MRFPQWLAVAFVLPAALFAACNRGSRPSQPGTPAPDFAVSDGATSVHLADFRGRVVLLNFWATWCAPCVAETPSLLQLHHDMPELAIIGVSVDDDPEAYAQFLARRHIDFTTVRDPNESAPKLFHSSMWPETYVIDRQGIIRRKFIGAQDWSSPEIRAYLKSL